MNDGNRKRQIVIAACLLLVGAAIGFGISKLGSGGHTGANLANPEPPAMTEPGVVGIEELRAPAKDRLIVDVRPYLFFKQGHIPGAINLAKVYYIRDFSRHEKTLYAAENKKIVLYCSSADCEDASFVAKKLFDTGLKKVHVFTGGWAEWEEAKLPEEKE